jgi:hypothetical protein
MKQTQISIPLANAFQWALSFLFIVLNSIQGFGQKADGSELERIPASLETDFALSSLPPHVRSAATVYLLDPEKGYYIGRQGSNGFICFVVRTEWEWGEFRNDLATPISFDAEGARTIFPAYADVEAMRASGKFTALQIKDTMANRFNRHYYKAPARQGISYMVAPIMRTHDGASPNVMTMSLPHYMFYAPYLTAADIGGNSQPGGPMILGDGKGPHGYIIIMTSATEKAKIMDDNKELLKRLADYKSYFKVGLEGSHH